MSLDFSMKKLAIIDLLLNEDNTCIININRVREAKSRMWVHLNLLDKKNGM